MGVLLVGTPDYPTLNGFLHGLNDAGYIVGETLIVDMGIKGSYDELRPVAKAYNNKKLDVVVTFGETTTAIAVKAIRATPIVFIHAIDPVGMGFVKSLAHLGTTVTGIMSYSGFELQAKRLKMFKELVPHLRRVAVLYNARGEPHHETSLATVRTAASRLGMTLVEKPVTSAGEAEQAVSSISRTTADGIFVICSFLFNPAFKKMAAVAAESKLPLTGCTAAQVAEEGGLWIYAPNIYRLGYRGASYVDRILKGARPEDLSVEAPMEFNFVVNLKTAKALGLTIPPSVLLRADEVIR